MSTTKRLDYQTFTRMMEILNSHFDHTSYFADFAEINAGYRNERMRKTIINNCKFSNSFKQRFLVLKIH